MYMHMHMPSASAGRALMYAHVHGGVHVHAHPPRPGRALARLAAPCLQVRAVIGCLATGAPSVLFTSEVVNLVGEVILTIDETNGNLAASLCKMLQNWRALPLPVRDEARGVLERVQARPGCSKNASEVAATALR